jgi:hypothetical protein
MKPRTASAPWEAWQGGAGRRAARRRCCTDLPPLPMMPMTRALLLLSLSLSLSLLLSVCFSSCPSRPRLAFLSAPRSCHCLLAVAAAVAGASAAAPRPPSRKTYSPTLRWPGRRGSPPGPWGRCCRCGQEEETCCTSDAQTDPHRNTTAVHTRCNKVHT